MTRATALLCLVLALPAWGGEPARDSAPRIAASAMPGKWYRRLGASLELGVPDVIGVSLVGRPLKWLRLQLGIGTNTAAVGVHGGITFVPLDRKVSPSLTIEGGHMFEGSSSFINEQLSSKSYAVQTLRYDYANLHLGIEVGLPNRFLFYAHAGASFLSMQLTGEQRTQPKLGTLTLSDPNLQIWTFSGKLGLVVFFL